MAPESIVFALANPDPEVHPDVAARHAAVVATGRSDFPNQINNVLAFPGIFRGALDAGAAAHHRGDEARRRRRDLRACVATTSRRDRDRARARSTRGVAPAVARRGRGGRRDGGLARR